MDEVSNLASGIISKTLARNVMECGCKGAHLIVQMHVVSPQGKLKN